MCPWLPRVRYTTSAELLRDLTASLADHSLPQRLRYDSNFDLLAIDEFGFDRIEGAECGQAAIRTEFAEKPGCITLRPVCWPQTVVVEKFKTREKALSLTRVSRGDRTSIELFRKGVEALASTLPFMQQALAWLLGSASLDLSLPE